MYNIVNRLFGLGGGFRYNVAKPSDRDVEELSKSFSWLLFFIEVKSFGGILIAFLFSYIGYSLLKEFIN
jgi:hypothetical protein